VSPARTAAVALLYPSGAPQAAETSNLVERLRGRVVPAAQAGSGLHVLIGGVTATQVDFSRALAASYVRSSRWSCSWHSCC
jgi:RND superfamily putative drug exporter